METVTLQIASGKSYADFAALEEGTLAQLIKGEIIMSPAPTVLHQHIVLALGAALRQFVGERNLGIVLIAPVDVRLAETEAYQPDVIFISQDRLGILREHDVNGAPDLVVEVLSPSTGYYDLTHKRRMYEQAGVREYWVIDPGEHMVEVLTLTDGRYETASRCYQTGQVDSVPIEGFTLELAPLFTLMSY